MIRGVRVPRAARVSVLALLVLTALPAAADAPPTGWVRVQLDGRISAADRSALGETGLRAFQYVPENAYLAFAVGDAARRAAGLPGVTEVRSLRPDEKVDRGLRGLAGTLLAEVIVHGPVANAAGARLGAIATVTDRYALDAAGDQVSLVVRLPAVFLATVAADPAVLHVGPAATGVFAEDEGTSQILAGNLQGNVPTPGYEPFLASRGLSGEGVVISISDTGIDSTHPEHQGRVVTKINYTTPPSSPDTGGHGTHVAGIVGGRGAALVSQQGQEYRAKDHEGFLLGLGIAPKVSFVDQSIIPGGSFVGGPPSSFERYSADAVRAGAVGWNASWNTGAANSGYVARARSLDIVTRNADFDAEGDEPFTMVFSAGNSGSGARTITQPKEAKNIITVGSTHSQRVLPASTTGVDTISSFSSRGPTRDGRIAPTVAAPGQDVVSSTSGSTGGSCTYPTAAGGAVPFTVGLGRYSTCSGTSMAAPQVTGAVALIHEWWRKANDGADPSPAMSKALLVNTATDMGASDIPNGNEGWGRVNLGTLFDPQASRVYLDQSVVFTDFDQTHAVDVEAVDPSKPFKVTLTWTDAAGAAGATRALVNDLDLRVDSADGTSYLGNRFSGGMSVAGGAADRLNNVESVYLPAGHPGPHRVTVTAFNVPGDAIPGDDLPIGQDFALVISNARIAAA